MKRILLLIFALTFSLSAWAADQLHNQDFYEGNIKFGKQDYRGALIDLNKSIEQNPDDTIAIVMRAACKGKVDDWDGALADAENAVTLAEKSGDGYLSQYKVILNQVKDGKARHDAEAAQPYASHVGVQWQSVSPSVQPRRSHDGAVNPDEMVAAHNRWRAQVGVPDITYSDTLAASAQAWVNNLRDTRQCSLQHSTGDYGENLYWTSAQDDSSTEVVDDWGSEKKDYNYADNTCISGAACGHYTQIVWKRTTSVGCAMAVCRDKSQVWACQYSPAGNYVGQKPY